MMSPEELTEHIAKLGHPEKRCNLYHGMCRAGFSQTFAGMIALNTPDELVEEQLNAVARFLPRCQCPDCKHERLNEDGQCRMCGEDCRGIGYA